VKGAIEFTTQESDYKATGHGVLSGEHYVYQANVDENYDGSKNDGASLRMWWHRKPGRNQRMHLLGPTVASPPFNSIDLCLYQIGDFHQCHDNNISITIADYKQVGAWYEQTDGPIAYFGSDISDIFIHCNDDCIKSYYSDAKLSRATIWKVKNDPVIQMGWASYNVRGIEIDTLNIIHSRYISYDPYVPRAIIGASPKYCDNAPDKHKCEQHEVDNHSARAMSIKNVHCETICPALMTVNPLVNYLDFKIEGVYLDGLINACDIGLSRIPAYSDGVGGVDAPWFTVEMDVKISEWIVGDTTISMKADNWQRDQLGKFDISATGGSGSGYWGQWTINEA